MRPNWDEYFMADYPDELTLTILTEGGVNCVKWEGAVSEAPSFAEEVRTDGDV